MVNALARIGAGRIVRLIPAVVGAVCLAPFVELITRDDAIVSDASRDYAVMHLPLAEFEREELLAGHWPLWNPYVACGQPLQAAQQAMPFYPFSAVLCLICGANRGLEVSLFVHLALCYVGSYLLARFVELSAPAAAYAALLTTWSGALIGHLAEGHAGAVFATALVPWFFLALARLLRRPTAIASMGLAASGALCALAAQPQVLYYTAVAGTCWSGGSLWCGAASAHRARAVALGMIALSIALLLAAVQLVPVIELMRDGLADSDRGTARFGATFALNGADSARLLMPYLNGTPFAGVVPFDSSDHYCERVVYIGLSAPALAAYGLSRAGATKWQWGAAWGVVAALAVAFGDSTPGFLVLGHVVPGLLLFRCPGRVFCVAAVPAALLAARGLDVLSNGEGPAGRKGWLGLSAILLATLTIPAYAAWRVAPSFDWPRYGQYARDHLSGELALWTILVSGTLVILALAKTRRLRGPAVWLALLAVTAIDLGYFNIGNFRTEPLKRIRANHPFSTNSMTRLVEAVEVQELRYDFLRYSHWTAAAIFEHRLAVGTYDGGVLPAATARLYKSIENDPRPALALAACGSTCSSTGETVELRDAPLPRVRFLPDGLRCSEMPIEEVTLLEVREMERNLHAVRLIDAAPHRLEMEVIAPADGWLVVADTYYPGWTCSVDLRPAPIECAHGVFRRVRLSAGHHRVLMRYEPISLRVGLWATTVGIVLLVAITAFNLATKRIAAPTIAVFGPVAQIPRARQTETTSDPSD